MKKSNTKKTIQIITALACLALGGNTAFTQDQDGSWIGTQSGNWSDGANWVGGTIAGGAGFSVIGQSIGATAVTRTITVDGPRTIGRLTMTSNGRAYQFTGDTITLAGNGVFVPPLIRDVSSGANGKVIMDCVLDGTEGVRLPDATDGDVYFNAANIYSGTTIVYRGTLHCGNPDAIPHGAGKGNVQLTDLDSVVYPGHLNLQDNSITINGLDGGGSQNQCTVLSSTPGEDTVTLTLGDGDANGSYSGQILNGARTLALTKIGAGKQILTGVNSFSGPVTVSEGTLEINAPGSLDDASQTITVESGGTLQGNGTIAGAVTVQDGGNIGAGSSPGQLTIGSGLDLSAGGTYVWDLAAFDDSEGGAGTSYDQIVMPVNAPVLGGTSKLQINFDGVSDPDGGNPFWSSAHSWRIISGPSGVPPAATFSQVVNSYGGRFTTAISGDHIVLNYTPGAGPTVIRPRISSISGAGTTSVIVNYTNTISGTNYVLRYRTNMAAGVWTTVGNKTATGTSDSQTDTPPAGSPQRFYQVYYVTQ